MFPSMFISWVINVLIAGSIIIQVKESNKSWGTPSIQTVVELKNIIFVWIGIKIWIVDGQY